MLHVTTVGKGRPRLAFLHGLFGQGKNWASIAKALQPDAPSLLVDLPNHGRSPWTTEFDYEQMADAVADALRAHLPNGQGIVVAGHSMGGKTAMLLALRHPDLVRALVVLDIAPDDSSHGYGFDSLVAALRSLDLTGTDRDGLDRRLAADVPDAGVRAFLLQNLRRHHGEYRWRVNLDLIAEALPAISGWPHPAGTYEGPVLWLRGADSSYVRDEHVRPMTRMFPRTQLTTVPDAGHWLHSDQPEAVTAALREFLIDHHVILRGGPVGPAAFSRSRRR